MIHSLACGLLLLLALGWDVKTHRIPNGLILTSWVVGMTLSLLPDGLGWSSAAMGSLAGLLAFLPLYLLRILGAGDVKLLSAVGTYVGAAGVLQVALWSGLAGGVLALFLALRHGELSQVIARVRQFLFTFTMQLASGDKPSATVTTPSQHPLPYAAAIALGTLAYEVLHF